MRCGLMCCCKGVLDEGERTFYPRREKKRSEDADLYTKAKLCYKRGGEGVTYVGKLPSFPPFPVREVSSAGVDERER